MGQTIGFVLNVPLAKGTQYWFDLQVTDSSTVVWTYSNPAISVMDIMPADFVHDNTAFSSNANTCTHAAATTTMAGLSFVTGAVANDMGYTTTSFGSGNIHVVLSFNLANAAVDGSTSAWTVFYGTGTAPVCGAGVTGTVFGNTYTSVYVNAIQTVAFTIDGLSPATRYWFDVRTVDSGTSNWIYSNPEISVVELP